MLLHFDSAKIISLIIDKETFAIGKSYSESKLNFQIDVFLLEYRGPRYHRY